MAETKLNGLPALKKKLEGLSYDVAKKGGRFALRKAAQVIRDRAKRNAQRFDDPTTAENIARNIAERWDNRFNKQTNNLKFKVGVLGGARAPKGGQGTVDNPFYWRFLEFGTEEMRAQPFMRPAGEQGAQAATDTFIREFGKATDRALKKAGK